MGAVHTISIEVEEDVARDIDAAVASGDYADEAAVVREALEVWQQERLAEIERLRRLVEEALTNGEARPVPDDWAEQIIAEGQRRLTEERRGSEAA